MKKHKILENTSLFIMSVASPGKYFVCYKVWTLVFCGQILCACDECSSGPSLICPSFVVGVSPNSSADTLSKFWMPSDYTQIPLLTPYTLWLHSNPTTDIIVHYDFKSHYWHHCTLWLHSNPTTGTIYIVHVITFRSH